MKVYRKWILQEKPIFMEEPSKPPEVHVDVPVFESAASEPDGKPVWMDDWKVLWPLISPECIDYLRSFGVHLGFFFITLS